ncbi:RNA-binding protein [Bacillus cytotoxicus]|uniref:RNA-binding S4 domain protein n=1 Tax=Bacillus cytotoxicus TaxID=580165 RepID=A0AAX2CJ26_9BACI|nr:MULTISPECIES: RNA-binding protein [Bacillus cereus group]AWC33457.1 RNA-binding protein [Bacillus cytotoxicus]AWC37435.1 RNA-binding protein [Bacillus cytotoxicus]AWC45419.1 RNA-binding protein [Bacillus cytotoxicus]AWC61705.1 RNA-binding protein [Bacillus cytotoxicus]KMT51615.1 RNA-binding protein S4 [Bacillus cytotoxicus]
MSIYEHFRPEEASFVDKVLEWKRAVEEYHQVKLTDFLDPRQQQIVTTIVGQQGDVSLQFNGAAPKAERKRALFYPDYLALNEEEFQVEVLEIDYPSKFYTLEHRQILGALMSLGLKREKYGDIFIQENRVQIVVAKEVVSYIEMNLQSIGKTKVSLFSVSAENVLQLQDEWREQFGTVSSLRLDVVLAEILHLSRQKVQPLIKNGLVKVNWKVVDQTSYECLPGDILSVRGHGRSKLFSVDGRTKKDKWRVLYGILK